MMAQVRRFISSIRQNLHESINAMADSQSLPKLRRDDDLFLVEFPKSGITWLTFLFANVNALLNNDPRSITFFNVNDYIPDLHSTRYLGECRQAYPGYRVFKSHSAYVRGYRKVFYLVRDPRHVMVSYWAFLKGLGAWNGTLAQLIEDRRYGISSWVGHVEGWLNQIEPATSFALIRYEDIVRNPASELRRLYQLLGFVLPDEIIATAIERSRIEKMRELEADFANGHPALQKLKFVRPGAVGGAREPLPEGVRETIERRAGPLMTRLGYEVECK